MNTCSFCDKPAMYDGQVLGHSSWAYACKQHVHMLGYKKKLPDHKQEGSGRAKTYLVNPYMEDVDTAIAPCECGWKQLAEADAEYVYCTQCGAMLAFDKSPLDVLFEE